jgi:hypothetical protein
MNYFRGGGMFGSAFLGAHLMRGAAAAALLVWAIIHQTAHPWLSLGAGVAALFALRGCPMCWTVGLVETLFFRKAVAIQPLNALIGHGCINIASGREDACRRSQQS